MDMQWPARSTHQATRRHPGASAESCFLPDLTRFTGARRAGPDMARAGREHCTPASVASLGALPEPVSQVPARALLRARRPGPHHERAAQRGARRPHQPRVPVLRAAWHRQDHHRPHPGPGAQLSRARRRRRALRQVRELPGGRGRHVLRSRRARRRVQQRGRRDARPHPERAPRRGRHEPAQGLHRRRGAHALGGRVEHVAEDARGAARARGVRARDHGSAEGAADDPFAHAALRVHAALARRARGPSPRRARSRRAWRPTPSRSTSSRAAPAARPAMRCRCSTRPSRSAAGTSTTAQVHAALGGVPFEQRVAVLDAAAERRCRRRVGRCARDAGRRPRRPPGRRRPAANAARRVPLCQRRRSGSLRRSGLRSGAPHRSRGTHRQRRAWCAASRCWARRSSTFAVRRSPTRGSCSRSRWCASPDGEARTREETLLDRVERLERQIGSGVVDAAPAGVRRRSRGRAGALAPRRRAPTQWPDAGRARRRRQEADGVDVNAEAAGGRTGCAAPRRRPKRHPRRRPRDRAECRRRAVPELDDVIEAWPARARRAQGAGARDDPGSAADRHRTGRDRVRRAAQAFRRDQRRASAARRPRSRTRSRLGSGSSRSIIVRPHDFDTVDALRPVTKSGVGRGRTTTSPGARGADRPRGSR